jgi:Met-zincin/Domain of unknown function (DUF5117)
MRRSTLTALAAGALAAGWLGLAGPAPAQTSTPAAEASAGQPQEKAQEKKFEDFDKVTKGAKELDGLFRLHRKDEHVYAEIRPDQFDKMFLCPIAIARGAGMGGDTLNFGDQWVLFFRRVGDKVHLVRRNVHFKARKELPVARAVETTYTDSVLLALKIHSINPMRQSVLIDLNDIFMSNFAQVPLGGFDSNRSTWEKVKAFPRNIELEVAATFAGGRSFGSDDVIDSRGTTVMIHYGLVQLPDNDGYQPRLADDRVGHFLSVVKDFSSDGRDTTFVRYVNRWRLERAENDPKNPDKLSPPKKKIVFWIEKSVPDEYRAYVREGILEWNKAFAQVGFRDAIEVRQQENEDFDPEDINYNTFRWITTDRGFAMGPSRANPLTGEILDADILFDASMVTAWKRQYQLSRSGGGATAYDEPVSMIQAAHRGWGLGEALTLPEPSAAWDGPRRRELEDPAARERLAQQWAVRQGVCQCGACMSYELGLAAMVLAARGETVSADKVPEELIGQAIKEVTMHEVGHTLGLRHNFKASTMLKNEQLHDTAITRKLGLVGSVMDYSPINLAPKGVKQGDYFTTTLGPYDYWAIAYAYKPLSGGPDGEAEKLQEIANKGAEPGHDYSTDEDLYSSSDPLVNLFDLGADPMKFAQDRMVLAEELFKDLAEKGAEKGEGYQRLRQAFNLLLNQYGNGTYLIARNIGGESMHRDHRGDPAGRDPFVPVPAARQREALKFLQEHILTDRTFQFSPQLLRRLAADRWMHWGTEGRFGSVEYPLNERILAIQRIALNHALDGEVLRRVQNNALKADKEEQPLTVAEVFRSLTDGIWSEAPNGAAVAAPPKEPNKEVKELKDVPPPPLSSVVRRNLQREYVKDLSSLVAGSRSGADAVPADSRSLARMHLRDIQKRIEAQLKNDKVPLDDTTRAHLEECQERIAKVLAASVHVNEP